MKLRKLKPLLAVLLVLALLPVGNLTILAESGEEIIEQDMEEEVPKESTEPKEEEEPEPEKSEEDDEEPEETEEEEDSVSNEEMPQNSGVMGFQRKRAALPIDTYSGLKQALEDAEEDGVILISDSFSWEDEALSIEKNLTIASAGNTAVEVISTSTRHFKVADGVTVTFENVILDGDETGGGMEFLGSGTLIGANIQNCLAENGGGVYAQTDITIINSVFVKNRAIGAGTAKGGGGGVYADRNIIITNSTFDENESGTGSPTPSQNTTGKGGGACAMKGTVTITDSDFTGNFSSSGGGIWAEYDVTVTNSRFSENKAIRDAGGGVFSNMTITVEEGSVFTGNEAYGGGGVNGDKVVIADSTFINNSATGGGAVFIWTKGGEISESTFIGNTGGSQGGGAIYVYSGGDPVEIKGNNLFKDNTATGKGGIIHASSYSNAIDIKIDVGEGNVSRFETESDTAIYSAKSNVIISGNPAFLYIKGAATAIELGSGNLNISGLETPSGSIYNNPAEPNVFAAVGTPEVSLNSEDMTLSFTGLAHEDFVKDSEFRLLLLDDTGKGWLSYERDGSRATGVATNYPGTFEFEFFQRIFPDGGGTWYDSQPAMLTLVLEAEAEASDVIFDPVLEGYDPFAIIKTSYFRNSGTASVNIQNFAFDKGDYFFDIQDPSKPLPQMLYPKEILAIDIQPEENLSSGVYRDTITYTTSAGNFSAEVVFTVCEDPVVTVSPGKSAVRPNGAVTLTAAVEKGTGNFSYRWQSKDEATGLWNTIPNETNQKLSVSRETLGQYKFRCIVTDSGKKFESNEVTVTVENQSASESSPSERTSSEKGSDSVVFTVEFETNGGSAVKSRNVSQNGKLTQPNEPIREGYTFTGWYTDTKLTTLYNFNKAVTEALTLYAGWEAVYEEQEEPKSGIINSAYISGYPDGTFRPDGTLTRGEAASILYNLALQDGKIRIDLFGIFDDVNENDWYYIAVGNLAGWGIISGYSDGTFKADETITRGELVSMTMRFAEFEQATGAADFTDVPESHWASAGIGAAVKAGFVSGYPDGTFRPDAGVTRSEAVSMVNRVTGRKGISEGTLFTDVPSTHWAYEAITAAATDY